MMESTASGRFDGGAQLGSAKVSSSVQNDVHGTFARVSDLVTRVEALAERLCGAVPEGSVQSGISPSNGILEDMRDHAKRVDERLTEAAHALNRIERMIA